MLYQLLASIGIFYCLSKVFPRRSKTYQLLCVFVSILIIGFRENIGGDWKSYQFFFEWSKTVLVQDAPEIALEPSFFLINKYLASYTAVNLLSVAMSLILIWKSSNIVKLKNFSFFLLISFLILPILLLSGFIRQGIAASFFCLAASIAFNRHKVLLPLLIVFLGLTFHNPTKRFILNSMADYLQAGSTSQLDFFSDRRDNNGDDKSTEGADRQSYTSKGAKFRVLLPLTMIGFLFAASISFKAHFKNISQRNLILFAIYLTASLLVLIFIPGLSAAVDRINYYAYPFIFLILAKSTESLEINKKQMIFTEVCLIMISMIFLTAWISLSDFSKYYTHF